MVASKIMVAYDGSEHSHKALEWALSLQERKDATVEVITVLPPVSSFYIYQTPSPNIPSAFDLHKKQKESLIEEMTQLVKDCAARRAGNHRRTPGRRYNRNLIGSQHRKRS